jgi:hypothetical protein
MSVLKVNKFQQLEGGPFTTVNNLCNVFVEPMAGVIDLTKSYIELETKFKNIGGEYVSEGVFLGYVDDEQVEEVNYTPSALIKHCKFQCEKKGLLEENRYINRLNQTLEGITKTTQDHKGTYLYGRADPVLLDATLQTANLQVPLSDVLGCGELNTFPAEWLGKLQLQLEFENQNQIAYQKFNGVGLEAINFSDINNPGDTTVVVSKLTTTTNSNFKTASSFFPVGANCSITYNRSDEGDYITISRAVASCTLNSNGTISVDFSEPIVSLPAGINITDIVLNNNGVDSVPMADIGAEGNHSQLRDNTGNNNFNVGDNVAISYSLNPGTSSNYDILVTQITTKTINEGYIVYGIADELPKDNVSDILVVEHNWEALSYEIQKVNLVLFCLPMKQAPLSLVYNTYHVEMDNMLATNDYRRQFDLEENTYRAMMLTPVNSLVSTNDNANAYRVSIDNVDTTNRDVVINYTDDNTLYYDRLIQNMDNVQSLLLVNDNLHLFVIPQTCPPDSGRHVLNVRLYSDTGMQAKVVYMFKKVASEVNK